MKTLQALPNLQILDYISSNPPLIIITFLLLGLGIAFIWHFSRFCIMGAVADYLYSKDTKRLQQILIFAITCYFFTTFLRGFLNHENHDYRADIYVFAENIHPLRLLFGGVLMGLGMFLASGCPTQQLLALGLGRVRALLMVLCLAIAAHISMTAPLMSFFQFFEFQNLAISHEGGFYLWFAFLIFLAFLIIKENIENFKKIFRAEEGRISLLKKFKYIKDIKNIYSKKKGIQQGARINLDADSTDSTDSTARRNLECNDGGFIFSQSILPAIFLALFIALFWQLQGLQYRPELEETLMPGYANLNLAAEQKLYGTSMLAPLANALHGLLFMHTEFNVYVYILFSFILSGVLLKLSYRLLYRLTHHQYILSCFSNDKEDDKEDGKEDSKEDGKEDGQKQIKHKVINFLQNILFFLKNKGFAPENHAKLKLNSSDLRQGVIGSFLMGIGGVMSLGCTMGQLSLMAQGFGGVLFIALGYVLGAKLAIYYLYSLKK